MYLCLGILYGGYRYLTEHNIFIRFFAQSIETNGLGQISVIFEHCQKSNLLSDLDISILQSLEPSNANYIIISSLPPMLMLCYFQSWFPKYFECSLGQPGNAWLKFSQMSTVQHEQVFHLFSTSFSSGGCVINWFVMVAQLLYAVICSHFCCQRKLLMRHR